MNLYQQLDRAQPDYFYESVFSCPLKWSNNVKFAQFMGCKVYM